jgi:hypothetical protein
LDEKMLTFAECQAQYGHSPVGVPCVRSGPAPSSQQSYNVILAVDVRVGCICYLIYRGTLDRDTFYCWVALQVTPTFSLSFVFSFEFITTLLCKCGFRC